MKKINWKPIGDVIGQACEFVLYGAALAASFKLSEYIVRQDESLTVGYKEAVGAIMDSNMFSHYKTEAVEMLKRYESSEYYGAIIRIVKDSSMFSHDKVKMIKHLSEN